MSGQFPRAVHRGNGIIGLVPMWKPVLPRDAKQPVFRVLLQAIADDITSGKLTPGTRLPPHRDLADDLVIARGTVARAYLEAEKLGLVRGEVGRGTIVLAPDKGERAYSSLLEAPTVQKDFSTNLPLSGIDPAPASALRALAERPDRSALLRYLPPQGATRHRMAGVQWLRRLDVEARVEDVLLCAGAQHALFVIFSHLARHTRTVYVEELTYPGVHGLAEALDLTLVPVGTNAEGMDVGDLARAVRRHGPGVVYCMPTIHNPTGAVMSEAQRRQLAAIAQREDLFIVEDAASRMLDASPPPPVIAFAPERTFFVASVSKILLPGLRVAFVVGPKAHMAALSRLVWASQWMVGALGAELVSMWLEDGVVDRTAMSKRRAAKRRQAIASRALTGCGKIVAHPSALHVWLTLANSWNAERFAHTAAKRRIVVTPSSAFWSRPTPPPRAIRISLGGVDHTRALREGLEAIATLARAAR